MLALVVAQVAEELCSVWVSLPIKTRHGVSPLIAHYTHMTINMLPAGFC